MKGDSVHMAGNMHNMNIKMHFDADVSRAQKSLVELHRNIDSLSRKAELGNNVKLKDASEEAERLKSALSIAFNSDLGELNLKKFQAALGSSGRSLSDFHTILKDGGEEGQKVFDSFASTMMHMEPPIKRSTKLADDLFKTLSNTVKWSIASSLVNTFSGQLQKAFYYTKDLNQSLTNIRIVTGQSSSEMARFADHANKAARALGATTLEYANASLIYYQQGKGDQEVERLTDITLRSAKVSKASADEMSNYLTAVWNGYKIGVQGAERAVDGLAAVAASTASDLEELSIGMSKVASAASNMGVDIDQLSGMLATVSSVTREAPETIGTTFKTIFSRMTRLSLGETDEDGVDFGEVEATLRKLGLTMVDTKGNLKDMGVAIDEIGDKWTSFSRESQIALVQAMAGTRQYSRLLSLFDNWDMYEDAVKVSQESAGTLNKQFHVYMESWEASSKRVTASLENLWNVLINDKVMINLNNSLSNIIDLFGDLTDASGGFLNILLVGMGMGLKTFSAQAAVSMRRFKENFHFDEQKEIFTKFMTFLKNTNKLDATEDLTDEEITKKRIGEQAALKEGIAKASKYLNEVERESLRIQTEKVSKLKEESIEMERQKLELSKKESALLKLQDNFTEEDLAKIAALNREQLDLLELLQKEKILRQDLYEIARKTDSEVLDKSRAAISAKLNSSIAAMTKDRDAGMYDYTDAEIKQKAINNYIKQRIGLLKSEAQALGEVDQLQEGYRSLEEIRKEQVKLVNSMQMNKENQSPLIAEIDNLVETAKKAQRSEAMMQLAGNTMMLSSALLGLKRSVDQVMSGDMDLGAMLSNVMTTAPIAIFAIKSFAKSFDALNLSIKKVAITSSTVLPIIGILATTAFVLNNVIKTTKELAEAAEVANKAIKESSEALTSNQSWVSKNKERYEELSKGVSVFGKNLSLTDQEFEEHNNLANQIGEMFPKLISGYTETGVAILKTKDNVNELTKSLEEEKKATEQIIDMNSSDIMKGFKAKTDGGFFKKGYLDEIAFVKKAMEGELNLLELKGLEDDFLSQNRKVLEKAGIKIGVFDSASKIEKIIEDNQHKLVSYLSYLEGETRSEVLKIIPVINRAFDLSEGFNNLQSDTQDAVKMLFSNLGAEFYQQFEGKDDLLRDWVNKLTQNLDENSGLAKQFNKLFDLSSLDTSAIDYVTQIEDVIKDIAEAIGQDPIELKLQLGIDTDAQKRLIEDVYFKLQSFTAKNKELDNYISSLSMEDLEYMYSIEPVPGWGVEDFKKALADAKSFANSISPITVETLLKKDSKFNKIIDEYQDKLKTLNDAMAKISEQSMYPDDIADLIQDIPELLPYVDNLGMGIYSVMKAAQSDALEKLNEQISLLSDPSDAEQLAPLIRQIEELDAKIFNTVWSIGEYDKAIDKMKSGEELKNKLLKYENDNSLRIPLEILEEILKVYPALEQQVVKYNSGIIDTATILKDISGHYTKLEDDYHKKAFVQSYAKQVKELADLYGIEFGNFKNLQVAKAQLASRAQALDIEYAKIMKEANDYYFLYYQTRQQTYLDAAQTAHQSALALNAERDALKELIEALQNWNPPKFDVKFDVAGAKLSKFSNLIDYTTEAIKKLQNELDKLNIQLSNTDSLEKQIEIYDKIIKKQLELGRGYSATASVYRRRYSDSLGKLSGSDRDKVRSGAYTIEDFFSSKKDSPEETRYNNIKEALEWKNKLQDVEKNLLENEGKIRDYAKKLADLRWDDAKEKVEVFSNSIDLLNAKLENTDGAKNKNKILKDILKEEEKILNQYKDTLKDNEKDVQQSYNKIAKSLRIGEDGKPAKLGELISTEGITNPKQLADIIQYNEHVKELRENTHEVNMTQEKYNKIAQETVEKSYANLHAELDKKMSVISNSRSAIENAIKEAESKGQTTTKKQYQDLIALEKQERRYWKEKERLAKEQLATMSITDDGYQELVNKIQEYANNVSKTIVNQNNLNRSMLAMPITEIEKMNKQLKISLDLLKKMKDDYDAIIKAVSDMVSEQIKAIQEQKKQEEKRYNSRTEALQKELENFKAINQERKERLELEKALFELERARNQKNTRVYREGQGFVYEVNTDAIRKAQETLDNLAYNKVISTKEKEIKRLQDEKDALLKGLDEQIESLEKIKEKWDEIANAIQKASALSMVNNILGEGWQKRILDGDEKDIGNVIDAYGKLVKQANGIETMIKTNEDLVDEVNNVIQSYMDGKISFSAATKQIEALTSNMAEESKKVEDQAQAVKELNEAWKTAKGDITTSITSVAEAHKEIIKQETKKIFPERLNNLQTFVNQYNAIMAKIAPAPASISTPVKVGATAAKGASAAVTKVGKSHKGMELGFIGNNMTSQSQDMFRMIALDKLGINEILRVLEVDEAVLTKLQQNNVLSNFAGAFKAGFQSKLPEKQTTINETSLSVGEIHVYEVEDAKGLVKAINNEFAQTFNQQLYK